MSIENLVRVKRSKRARRVALRLDPVERVVNLVVPSRMTLERAYYFAQENEEWVRKHLASLSRKVPFRDGAQIPLFGEMITLRIEKSPLYRRTNFLRNGSTLNVTTNLANPHEKIKNYLKKMAAVGLAEMAEKKAKRIRKKIKAVRVRDTKSRWGSCSEDGNLSFSWRLIFAPYEAIDYVVAHEVAHLSRMDHSAAFWKICDSLSEDYEEGRNWMRDHGNELMRYG